VLLSVLAFGSYNLVLQELMSSDQFQVSIFPFAHLVLFDAICMRPFPLAPWAPLHDCDSIDIGSTSVQSVRFWWKKESANSFLVPECFTLLWTLDSSATFSPVFFIIQSVKEARFLMSLDFRVSAFSLALLVFIYDSIQGLMLVILSVIFMDGQLK